MNNKKITFPEPVEKAVIPLHPTIPSDTDVATTSAPKMITREQVAGYLQVSLQTVINYTNRGLLVAYKIGRRVLYNETEVVEAIQSCLVKKYQHESTREFVFKY